MCLVVAVSSVHDAHKWTSGVTHLHAVGAACISLQEKGGRGEEREGYRAVQLHEAGHLGAQQSTRDGYVQQEVLSHTFCLRALLQQQPERKCP